DASRSVRDADLRSRLLARKNVRVPRFGIEARLWVLPTPIDEERLTLRLAASTRAHALLNRAILWGFARGAAQDFPIWATKRYLERPARAEGDGPIALYRRWSRQFYERVEDGRPVDRPVLAS